MILKKTFTLSNNITIPKVGFGTAPLKGDDAYEAVRNALKAGYIHIDTAAAYGNETDIARAIKDSDIPRENLFITSKLHASIKDYDEALKAFQESLDRLETSYLDLYLIHAPWPWDQKFSDHSSGNIAAYKALEALYSAGKIKAIGVSNFSPDDLDNIIDNCDLVPHVNQIKFHIGHPQTDTIKYCKDKNILIEAYSPLGRGGILTHDILKDMARKYQVSTAQLAVRYVLEKDILPLPRSSKPDHIINNAEVAFTLAADDMRQLDTLKIESIEFGTPVKKQ